jgi:flagellar hook assembly protein FlgD
MVHDVQGRLVRLLDESAFEAGVHEIEWDGCDGRGDHVDPGVYLVTLEVGGAQETLKLVRVP